MRVNFYNLSKRKVVQDMFFLYSGRGINLAVGLLSTLIYGSVFAKSGIAVISLFEMVVQLFLSFGFNWSDVGIIRFGKEEYLQKKGLNNTSSTRLQIIIPALAVSLLVLAIFRRSITQYIGTNDLTLIYYLMANILLLVIHHHITHVFTAVEQHKKNVVYFLSNSVGKLFILGLFWLNIVRISPELYLKMNVCLLLILLFSRIPFLKYEYIFPIKLIGHKKELLKFIKFVLPQACGFVGLYLINWMDVYFIRKYYTMDELGAYQFLYLVFLKIASLAFIINTVFFPKIIEWKNRNQAKLKIYLQKLPSLLFISSIVCVGIFYIAYSFLFSKVFGSKYEIAYPSFNILLWILPFYLTSFLFIPVLNSHDKVLFLQKVNIIGGLANFLIDLFFVKRYGIIAAAGGTFVCYALRYFIIIVFVMKMFKSRHKYLLYASIILCIFVAIYIFSNITKI